MRDAAMGNDKEKVSWPGWTRASMLEKRSA
jgi:hypothetical protein